MLLKLMELMFIDPRLSFWGPPCDTLRTDDAIACSVSSLLSVVIGVQMHVLCGQWMQVYTVGALLA